MIYDAGLIRLQCFSIMIILVT